MGFLDFIGSAMNAKRGLSASDGLTHFLKEIAEPEFADYCQKGTWLERYWPREHPARIAFESKDYASAIRGWSSAASSGDALAQYALGAVFDEAGEIEEAKRWYELAASNGVPEAQNALGVIYDAGEGVPIDYALASNWYSKAAKLGDGTALSNLGAMYESGHGVCQNQDLAIRYYHAGAKQGDGAAAFNVGLYFQNTIHNYRAATLWYSIAFELGCFEAMENFQELRRRALIPKDLFPKLGLKPILPHEF
jgi:TPR repeat protein